MKEKIREILSENGIYEWAVCDFFAVADHLISCRAKARLPENSKSIIIAAFPYKVNEAPPKNISRYAAVPDYHEVCGEMLKAARERLKENFPTAAFECFLDNSPIPEVSAAVNAGLGAMGKNGLLIHKKYGSYVFLGEIVTDLPLEADKGGECCLDCGQCAAACRYIGSKTECLSAVNQQKSGLTAEQTAEIRASGVCWGCDRCSEVCPMNKTAEPTYIKKFIEGYRDSFSPTEDREGRAYNWRGSEVIDRNYKIINSK